MTSPNASPPDASSPAGAGALAPADPSVTGPSPRAITGQPAKCPACAKPLPQDAARCTSCGLAIGEQLRCVHCRAIVDVVASEDARFLCSLCGGVRVPFDDPKVILSTEQIELLKKATVARTARTIWTALGAVVCAFAIFSGLVLALVASVASTGTAATLVGAVAVLTAFLFGLFAWRKAALHAAEFRAQLEEAWITAARDLGRAHDGVLDTKLMAKATRISPTLADQILARMSARSLVASSVTPEGDLHYTLLDARPGDQAKQLKP